MKLGGLAAAKDVRYKSVAQLQQDFTQSTTVKVNSLINVGM